MHKNMMSYHSEMMHHMGNHMGMMMTHGGTTKRSGHCPMAKGTMGGRERSKGHQHH
jgi:hypothetical protein